MVTLYLYGSLKEEFGEKFTVKAKSPIEAIRVLEANFPGRFLKAFSVGGFYVLRGKDLDNAISDTGETLAFQTGDDIHIAPEIYGSGFFDSGWFKVILGVVIIAAAVVTSGAAAGLMSGVPGAFGFGMAGAGFAGVSFSTYALFGAALVLSGISQMLTPTPKVESSKTVDPRASFIFQGAENIVAQGVPVPVIYGEVETGSVTIALSLSVEKFTGTDDATALDALYKKAAAIRNIFT